MPAENAARTLDRQGRAPSHCELCGALCYDGRRCVAHREIVKDGDNLDPWAELRDKEPVPCSR